jgi:hypothetical protein
MFPSFAFLYVVSCQQGDNMYTHPTIAYSMNMTRQSKELLMINREGVLLYTESTSKGQKLVVSGIGSQSWAQMHLASDRCIFYCESHRGGGFSLAGPLWHHLTL